MQQILVNSTSRPRYSMLLLSIFALVAMILAAVGIYGVMAYSVAQRTHEIGIRMALGAQGGDVLKMILFHGVTLAVIGIALGLLGALALTRLLSSLLFEVSVTDPLIFFLIPLILLTTALLACLIPARRATRVDPMITLRYE